MVNTTFSPLEGTALPAVKERIKMSTVGTDHRGKAKRA
jgi:hypothetical protein